MPCEVCHRSGWIVLFAYAGGMCLERLTLDVTPFYQFATSRVQLASAQHGRFSLCCG